MKNYRFINALLKQPVDCTPVWIMRQAGRYLPEYRKTREKAGDFMTLCKTPELACEVTLQPLARFDLDAAIIFSDILTIPDAMGLGLHFTTGEGPQFSKYIQSARDITELPTLDPEHELKYVMDAIRITRAALPEHIPLIGFAGSPWTIATYMVEGKSSKQFAAIKHMLYTAPTLLHQLLSHLAQCIADYLTAQINAGAQALMLFDTWGGMLTPEHYQQFSLYYMQQIINKVKSWMDKTAIVPIIVFTKQGGQWLEQIVECGCDAVGLDWTINIGEARRRIGDRVALQGNMDPAALYGSPETIRQTVKNILNDYGSGSGHVFNLGHGITPDINPEHVNILVDAVHELSQK